jgi:tripartite-type tricarboxylate transporter receptor subunit TctC
MSLACVAGFAQAQSGSDVFKGIQISVIVGASPGGGNDVYARLMAMQMGRFVPGNPNIIVVHMPGAGGMIAANHLYAKAAQDGTVIGAVHRSMLVYELLDGKGALFKTREFTWLGSLDKTVGVLLVTSKIPVTSFADLKTRGIILGATGAGGGSLVYPTLMNNLLGTKIKIVRGYKGNEDMYLAMERGETEARCCTPWSSVLATASDLITQKKVRPLLQFGLSRTEDLPDVPLVTEFAEGDAKKIFELHLAESEFGRPFLLPPGVPADRVKILRDAFMKMARDAEVKEAAKKLNIDIAPVDGVTMEKTLERIYATPPEIVKAARAAVEGL